MAEIRRVFIIGGEHLLDGATAAGATMVAIKERSNVISKEAQGYETAN